MIRVVHPGSRIRMLTFSRIPDPGVKKAPNPGSRIRIRNTGFYIVSFLTRKKLISFIKFIVKYEWKTLSEGNQIHNLYCVCENFFKFHFITVSVPLRSVTKLRSATLLVTTGTDANVHHNSPKFNPHTVSIGVLKMKQCWIRQVKNTLFFSLQEDEYNGCG